MPLKLYCFLSFLLLAQGYGAEQGVLPTAQEQFCPIRQADKRDTILVDLTYLSYLKFKIADLTAQSKAIPKITSTRYTQLTAKYKFEGWNVEFMDVGKGLFVNNTSPGAVFAHRIQDDICEVAIAFRGTRTLDDWGNNVNFTGTRLVFEDNRIGSWRYNIKVHRGFLKAYNTVSQKMRDRLEDLRKTYPTARFFIRVGGHSFGGSLATLCATHLALMFKRPRDTMHLETYGSPRTGNSDLLQALERSIGAENILRFVNRDQKGIKDVVPSLPLKPSLGIIYKHVGIEHILEPIGEEIQEKFSLLGVGPTPHLMAGYWGGYRQAPCLSREWSDFGMDGGF